MKSIIEQASSIMKAIEKAWDQAEKPKEFSIKVFEKEEKNFFGMTTKPAKIGIFFSDKPIVHEKTVQKPRPEIKECRPETRDIKPTVPKAPRETAENKPAPKSVPQKPVNRPELHVRPLTTEKSTPAHAAANPAQKKPDTQQTAAPFTEKPHRTPAVWNETMISTTHNWLKKTLSLMGMASIEFSSEVAGKHLKLTFNMPLVPDVMHEKQLFRSFAHLIMSSLRNQFKQEIKDLKVILIRPE